ncbi:MAG: extracellular solute-binding protein [Verrucomicrobia bacterium]|nr:extracellular solute-binding protein [Verrucomicrobiota bacterium]
MDFRLLLVGTFLVVCGCSPKIDDQREGLVVYAAGPRPLAEAVIQAFTAETGIPVELFAATTGQIMARLEAERYRPRADVVLFASELAAAALKQEGRLLNYSPSGLETTHGDWHDPDGYFWATSAAVVGVAVRSEWFGLPLDWDDFLGGNFSGRVTMPSPSRSGAAGDFVLAYVLREGEEAWYQFRSARRSGLQFSAANSQAITSLLIGAFDAIVGAVDYLIYRQIENGADIRMLYPSSGGALVTRPIAILSHTPFPERASRFVDFYFTPQVQQMTADFHILPACRETAFSAIRAVDGMPPLFSPDIEQALSHHGIVMRRFQVEIERAAVVRERRK